MLDPKRPIREASIAWTSLKDRVWTDRGIPPAAGALTRNPVPTVVSALNHAASGFGMYTRRLGRARYAPSPARDRAGSSA